MHNLRISRHDRLLVLAPHPDDETLAAGGLLHEAVRVGAAVRIVFVTDGESNPWPQRVALRRWNIGERERLHWAARRRKEAQAALAVLGVGAEHAAFLHYHDQGLTDLIARGDASLLADLEAEIGGFRPTLLVAPSFQDLHPDHNSLGLLIRLALGRIRPASRLDLNYVIHGAQSLVFRGDGWCLPLRAAHREMKRQALLEHVSQMMLSRRRLLRYTDGDELFQRDAEYVASDRRLPLHIERNGARQVLVHIPFGPVTATTLLLVAGPEHAIRLTLPAWLKGPPVLRGSGATASMNRLHRTLLLTLPESFAVPTLWWKTQAEWRFLDVCGWQPLAVPSLADDQATGRICCVIPCYDIAALCGPVVQEAARHADDVIAVDDGSHDSTRQVLYAAAAHNSKIHVLSRTRNAGKGMALLAAFRYALANLKFDALVTLDGDGQHRPADLPRLVHALHQTGGALVIGERRDFERMPWRSRIGNQLTSSLVRLLYHNAPKDTQSGYRALSRAFVSRMVRAVQGRRYETELQMLLDALANGLGVAGVAIPTIYLAGNRSSHFRPLRDSLRIAAMLLRCRLSQWRGAVAAPKHGSGSFTTRRTRNEAVLTERRHPEPR